MSLREQEPPEFSYSLRGYDRVEVDEYMAWLRDYALAIEERAAAAELALAACRTELASPGGSGFSQRLDAILQLANDEAADIRTQAEAEAEAVRQEAADAAARTLGEADARRAAVQREIDDLIALRGDLVQRLVDLADRVLEARGRYEGSAPGTATAPPAAVELFDGEALEVGESDAAEAKGDGDEEGDAEALTPSAPAPES